jgi:hypothetical protein
MTLIVQIQEYLENNESYSFRRGLELYEQAGPGPSWQYLRGFKYDRSPPDQVQEKLNEELRIFLEVLTEAGAPGPGCRHPLRDPAGTCEGGRAGTDKTVEERAKEAPERTG